MAYRGLEIATNLGEPLQNNQSLINLGGPGIDEDLALFVNNIENTTTLEYDPSDQDASIIPSSDGDPQRRFLFGRSIPFTFTNGDRVTITVTDPSTGDVIGVNVNGTGEPVDYVVVDFEFGLGPFESQRGFGVAETDGGAPLDLSGIDGYEVVFVRKDSVTQANILNIATPQINNSSDNLGFAISGGRDFFSYNVSGNFNEELEGIEDNINQANFKRRRKYSVSRSVSTDDEIRLRGSLRVDDPAGDLVSDSDFDNPNVPGVFITDPFSGPEDIEKARAFSTLGNPWDENGTENSLDTPSSQVNIGDLRFSDVLEINGLGVSDYENVDGTEFTHKIPMNVDGVTYFLLLRPSNE